MNQSDNNFKTLWKLMEGHRRRYLIALVAMFCGVGLMYITPLITRAAIDGVIDEHPTSDISYWAQLLAHQTHRWGIPATLVFAAAVMIAVMGSASQFMNLQGRLSGIASESIVQGLRNRLYAHLQRIPMTWHDKVQTGDIVQRCTSDVDTVRLFYREQMIDIWRTISRITIGFPMLLWLDWKMALYSTALMPIIVAFAIIFFRRVQGSFKKMDEAEGIMTAALQENLTGIRVVRAFARQEFEIERFTKKNAEYRDRNWKLIKVMAVYWSMSDLMCFTQFASIVFIGAWRASQGWMTIGTMIAFVSYAQMFIWPIREVGRVLTELGKSLVSIGRIKEVLNVPEETAPQFPIVGPEHVRGNIEFSHVAFRHGEKWVLRDITLSIPAGKTLALLGASGSGKTTLVNLLLRLYDHDLGTITLDGNELKSLDRKYVRSLFGAVLQEPFLYSKTLRDNIKLARHSAQDEEMVLAAQHAAIHESIEAFDDKYDTLIGERGVTLSGGQRQRTAIARALLKDAPIVILDDALSAVDTGTELSILNQIRRQRGKHTTIIIAHRLSTLMHADQIAVMEKGRIVQLGTHEELANQEGLYRRLWQIQGALADDLRAEMADETGGSAGTEPVSGGKVQ
jgi:ATP-binding cassette, subfamily B, bacterial